jgi:hypothetical protein
LEFIPLREGEGSMALELPQVVKSIGLHRVGAGRHDIEPFSIAGLRCSFVIKSMIFVPAASSPSTALAARLDSEDRITGISSVRVADCLDDVVAWSWRRPLFQRSWCVFSKKDD